MHSEAQTFERLPAAREWMKLRERELAKPGGIEGAKHRDPLLAEVIGQYENESMRALGKTKLQVLRTIKASELGSLRCSEVTSQAIVSFARGLDVLPQTVGNYMAHLASVARIARPAWGYPLDAQAMDDARMVLVRTGQVSRSKSRERRPAIAELEKLLQFFQEQRRRNRATIPMDEVMLFAMFSSRRQEEITRISWSDLEAEHSDIVVRDMKHPGDKVGNDVRTHLPKPALAVILRQPRKLGEARIFPFNSDSISASFTRSCKLLGIEDLHFHDLRHECISWLFELGWHIPRVASVSGHRSWASLRRYTQLRQTGDKYATWDWLPQLAPDLVNH